MKNPLHPALWLIVCVVVVSLTSTALAVHVGIDENNIITIGTRTVFPIVLTLPPPPTGLAPNNTPAYKELHDAGILFMRTGIASAWDANGIAVEKSYEDAAFKYGLYCQPWLRNLAEVTTSTGDDS